METQCCKKKGKKVGGRGCNVKTRAAWQGFHHGDAPVHTGCTHTHASTNTEQNRIKRKTVTGLKHTTTPQWRDYQTGHKDALKQTDNLPKLGMFSRCNTERSGFAGLGESVCTQKAILGREGSHLTTEDEGDGKGRFKRLTATTNTITRHSQEKKTRKGTRSDESRVTGISSYTFLVSFYRERGHTRSRKLQQQKLLHSSSHRDVLAQKWPPSADASRRTPVGLCAESVRGGRRSISHIFTRTHTHIEVPWKETSERNKKRHESRG